MSGKFRHFTFTINNYTDNDIGKLLSLAPSCKYLVYGKEVGDAGTPHLQGFVSFSSPRRFKPVAALIGGHVEVARNPRAAAIYCKKDGDYQEHGVCPEDSRKGQGKRSDLDDLADAIAAGETDRKKLRQTHRSVCAKYPNFVTQLIVDTINVPKVQPHPLRPWQQELNNILRLPPHQREIIFVVDRKGDAGKSWYVNYHMDLYANSINILPGKKADMVYAFMSMLTPNLRVVFVDAPRSKQGEFIQYDFLEELKNGSVFNTKYQAQMLRFMLVHVVVMMNEHPDMEKLSADRYHIINVEKEF